jgi:glycosyltransferase involved in cell wall biosynthesis
LNVLHVIPSLSPKHGGPSFALPLMTRALALHGVRTTIATTDDDGPRTRLDVPIGRIVSTEGGATIYFRKTTEFYKVSAGLRCWLKRHVEEFDVVHVHALFSFSSLGAARAARNARVPYIVRPLGVLNRWGIQNRRRLLKQCSLRWVERPALLRAAALHFTSAAEKREAAEAIPEIAHVPSAIIPPPIDVRPSRGDASDFQKEFPATKERHVILFLSRIDPKKGIELLLEAFAKIRSDGAMLVIAGDGETDYVQSLKLMAEQLRIGDRTLWTGFLSGERKWGAFGAATIFVLPSYSENFGIAAAEALAAGVPCILSRGVALAEKAGAAGAAIVTRCDAPELANAIERVLNDDRVREGLATKAAAFIESNYSLEAVGAQMVELYRRVTTGDLRG